MSDDTLAAVDLGSNSFHMVIARRVDPELRIIDRVREPVQLAAGLDASDLLGEEAQERALACLRRMGQRIRDIDASYVRAVGTNTIRKASNAAEFLPRAREALGHPVEVVSGREEARLIYLGVAHTLADDLGRRLVIDVGGGSTECILGERFTVLEGHSLHMGCVSYSVRFFPPSGELLRKHFKSAEIAARRELLTIEQRFRSLGWEFSVGASGTVRAVSEILKLNGWTDGAITLKGMRQLRKAMIYAGRRDALTEKVPGLKPDRAPVLPGGLAILIACFEALRVERLEVSAGALREGLLYDMMGRIRHEDVRDRTIRRVIERYGVDLAQASRVERTALYCLDRVAAAWGLSDTAARQLLSWGARLHEVGLEVDYTHYHKHGAYLVQHSWMPGFSQDDQLLLATLIRFHRRRLGGSAPPELLALLALPRMLRLTVLLRLAVELNRGRTRRPLPYFDVQAQPDGLTLTFPADWLAEHPLTAEDLAAEAPELAQRGVRLVVAVREP